MTHSPVILVIEDDKDVAEFYSHALEASGFESEVARTGEAALERLAAIVPDVVLLDLKLSLHLTGADILHHIRSDQRLAKTRVIVVTGHPDLAETVKAEADGILIKPIDVSQLSDLLTRFLQSDAGG
jgi:two-component system phosphate regulon response regulator PhoB